MPSAMTAQISFTSPVAGRLHQRKSIFSQVLQDRYILLRLKNYRPGWSALKDIEGFMAKGGGNVHAPFQGVFVGDAGLCVDSDKAFEDVTTVTGDSIDNTRVVFDVLLDIGPGVGDA